MSPRTRVLIFVVAVLLTVVMGGWWLCRPAPEAPDATVQADAVPGELLVEVHADRLAQLQADVPRRIVGGQVVVGPWSRMDDEVMARVLVPPGDEEAAAAEVRQESGVDSVERDYIAEAYGVKKPDDPLYPYQWNMRKVGAEDAWRGSTGQGVVVAIIDTGVAYENYKQFHRVEDMNAETFVPGFNAINNTEHANDDHAHGTHVAATVAEATNNGIGAVGLAPDAKIMPIKVLSGSGAGSYGAICDGIRFAADHHANVINMSLGGPIGSMALKDACRYAYRKGVTIVCAAGNNGSSSVGFPAKYDVCLAVSSIRDDNTLAWYSNRGSRIDIAAPGGDTRVDQNNDGYPDGILQNTIAVGDPTKEGYFVFQGTSMASPHVAAAAALVEALGITNPAAVKAVLQASATRQGIPDLKVGFGAGILNAGRAVRYVILGTGAAQFALALALLYISLALARGGDYARFNPLTLLALIPTSCGLFFLPYVPQLGTREIPYRDFLCRPLPAWDIHLLGVSQHANPLFYSALLPLLLSLALNRKHPWLQQLLIGFSVGYGACILHLALSEQAFVRWVPFSGAWLILNAALCVFIAVGLADARRPQRSR